MGRGSWRALAAGALDTGSVVAGWVAFGLLCAAAGAGPTPRAAEHATLACDGGDEVRFLIDGFNVLHAGVLRGADRRGWWREDMRARLLERVAAFDDAGAELWVVFDGSGPLGDAERRSERPRVVFAPSADEWLLAEVRDAADPAGLVVVTADRQLADRARHRGATVLSPRAFLARCAVRS